MIQLSILKITEYGPWTLTLGSDREHELQMLQASIYKKIQKLFSEKNCIVFLNRADEFFVVSNGLELEDHIEIQKRLREKFDIQLVVSIGHGISPYEANLKAYEGKKNETILSKENDIFGFVSITIKSKGSSCCWPFSEYLRDKGASSWSFSTDPGFPSTSRSPDIFSAFERNRSLNASLMGETKTTSKSFVLARAMIDSFTPKTREERSCSSSSSGPAASSCAGRQPPPSRRWPRSRFSGSRPTRR